MRFGENLPELTYVSMVESFEDQDLCYEFLHGAVDGRPVLKFLRPARRQVELVGMDDLHCVPTPLRFVEGLVNSRESALSQLTIEVVELVHAVDGRAGYHVEVDETSTAAY